MTDLPAQAFNAPDASSSVTDTIGMAIATTRLIATRSETGTRPRTIVPWPGDDSISASPPKTAIRSRIPWIPVPVPFEPGSNPPPSSATLNSSAPSRSRNAIVIAVAFAYFAAFWSASSAQK